MQNRVDKLKQQQQEQEIKDRLLKSGHGKATIAQSGQKKYLINHVTRFLAGHNKQQQEIAKADAGIDEANVVARRITP